MASAQAVLSLNRHPLYSSAGARTCATLAPPPIIPCDPIVTRLSNFLRKRNVDVETFGCVFDIGSRDALQAIELAGLFPNAQVVAIECNPADARAVSQQHRSPPASQARRKGDPFIHRALQFHPIDTTRTVTSWPDGNPGASSLFLALVTTRRSATSRTRLSRLHSPRVLCAANLASM